MADTVKMRTPPCIVCKESTVVVLDKDKFDLWQSGVLVQNAFPHMTPSERELLITGTHPECWEKMFEGGEDDDS